MTLNIMCLTRISQVRPHLLTTQEESNVGEIHESKYFWHNKDQSDETTPPTTQEEGDGGEPYEGDMGDPGDDYDPGEDVDDAGDEEDDDEEYDKDMDEEAIMEKYRRNQQEKEKKEKGGEDEEAMPEYDEATQVLIEGKHWVCPTLLYQPGSYILRV